MKCPRGHEFMQYYKGSQLYSNAFTLRAIADSLNRSTTHMWPFHVKSQRAKITNSPVLRRSPICGVESGVKIGKASPSVILIELDNVFRWKIPTDQNVYPCAGSVCQDHLPTIQRGRDF